MSGFIMYVLGGEVEVKFPEEFSLDTLTETYDHYDSNVDIVCNSIGKHILGRDMKSCEVVAIRNIMSSMNGGLQFEVYVVIEIMLRMIKSKESQK